MPLGIIIWLIIILAPLPFCIIAYSLGFFKKIAQKSYNTIDDTTQEEISFSSNGTEPAGEDFITDIKK